MLLYFNRSGQLLENSDYGQYPRVGSNNLQVFAYFEDIDLGLYPYALIRFKRPDLQNSEFPDLFMTKASIVFDSSIGRSRKFVNGVSYEGFVFDFSKVKDADGNIIMLDTPGTWEASITLISVENAIYNIQGLIKFNVAASVSWVDGDVVELDYSVITHNVAEALSNVLFKSEKQYLRVCNNLVEESGNGLLLKAIYVVGSYVFDATTKNIYVINSVSDNPDANGRVYAGFSKVGPFGTEISASPTNPLKIINEETGKFELLLTDVYTADEVTEILQGD